MYEEFYGFTRRPFAATPSAGAYVPLPSIEAARGALAACARDGQGIGVVTGAAGTGKTLLCLRLQEDLRDRFATALLPNANFPTRRSLLQAILHDLGHPFSRMAAQELRIALADRVRAVRPEREGVVLIFDEAHLLSDRLLEEIRTITNLTADGVPLARVVLAGQLLLEEKLAQPSLEAFNQRICCQVALEPLTRQESRDYLLRRIEAAGSELSAAFTPEAVRAIGEAADGSPRCLNQLADHALLLAFADEQRPASRETVLQALDDLRQLPLHWNEPAGFEHGGDRFPREALGVADDESVAAGDWDVEPDASFEIGHPPDDALREDAGGAIEADPSAIEVDWEALESQEAAWRREADRLVDSPPTETAADALAFEGPSRPEIPEFDAERWESRIGDVDESPVLDRYALLDAGLPLPGELEQSRAGRATAPIATSPDRRIDLMLPLLDQALRPLASGDTVRGGPPVRPAASSAELFAEDSAAEGARADDDSFEARLGNQVLEVCLETQQAIDARLSPPPPPRARAESHPQWGDAGKETADAEYDVVEPEPPRQSDRGGSRVAPEQRGGRDYRRLFSALQRRETAGG
ncbi:MAG: AAA family ATPase [Planctomycetales bacterium]